MGLVLEDPRSPMSWPRRRRSLRRRVAELERLLAEVENDAAQALAELRAELREADQRMALCVERSIAMRGLVRVRDLPRWLRQTCDPVDHEPAVERLEPEAAMRRTGSPT